MGSYDMIPDIEMTSPLPVSVAAAATGFNDGDGVGGNSGRGDEYDDMTAAFLPYKPPSQATMIAPAPAAMAASATESGAAAVAAGTILSAKVNELTYPYTTFLSPHRPFNQPINQRTTINLTN